MVHPQTHGIRRKLLGKTYELYYRCFDKNFVRPIIFVSQLAAFFDFIIYYCFSLLYLCICDVIVWRFAVRYKMDIKVLRATEEWQRAGAYSVRIQGMNRQHHIPLREEFGYGRAALEFVGSSGFKFLESSDFEFLGCTGLEFFGRSG